VRDPDGAVGLVDVLAARSLRAVGVDLQVALVDLDLPVVAQERGDDHRREGGVATVGAVERAQPDEPMLAALGLEDAVRVVALDRESGALQPRLLARARLEQLEREAAVDGPALVHAEHHLRPVLGVGPAGARLERHDRVALVVLALEQRLLLEQPELAPERDDRRLDLRRHLRIELEQVGCVVVLLPQALVHPEAPRDPGVLRRDPLGALLVVPEAGLAHLRLELAEPAL
jgi:hypothetical protein